MLAVDFGAIFWRAWKAADGGHAPAKALDVVARLCAKYMPDTVVVGLDSDRSVRQEKYPPYKSHRPPKPEGYAEAKAAVLEAISGEYVTAQREGWEADDILAYYATHPWREHEVIIASHDKDLLQLVDERVTVFNTYKDQRMWDTDVFERYQVHPWQMVDYLAIVGDPVDGVRGLKGWGPVRARKVLQDHRSIEEALAVGAIPRYFTDSLRQDQWLIRLMPDLDSSQDLATLAAV